jgi:hypothetical protein
MQEPYQYPYDRQQYQTPPFGQSHDHGPGKFDIPAQLMPTGPV